MIDADNAGQTNMNITRCTHVKRTKEKGLGCQETLANTSSTRSPTKEEKFGKKVLSCSDWGIFGHQ